MPFNLYATASCYTILYQTLSGECHLQSYFSEIFGSCICATTPDECLTLFKERSPDLVFLDADLSRPDGLETLEALRNLSWEVPIIMAISTQDTSNIYNAAKLHVNAFIEKPILRQDLEPIFVRVLQMVERCHTLVHDNEVLSELVETELRTSIHKEYENIQLISQLLDALPNPTIVLRNDKRVMFSNESFSHLLFHGHQGIVGEHFDFDRFFENRDGFCHDLDQLHQALSEERKVTVKTPNGYRIFFVLIREIMINDQVDTLYVFNDITREEYQKVKLKTSNDMLQELIVNRFHRRRAKTQAPSTESKSSKVEPKTSSEPQETRLTLLSAKEYACEIDDYVRGEIQELEEIEHELESTLYLYQQRHEARYFYQILDYFFKYSSAISLLFEFEELSTTLREMTTALQAADHKSIKTEMFRHIEILLDALLTDLRNWRMSVFVRLDTSDVHYLDASLLSSCIQLQALFSPQEQKALEDFDLELF